jgi:hypothetical protein
MSTKNGFTSLNDFQKESDWGRKIMRKKKKRGKIKRNHLSSSKKKGINCRNTVRALTQELATETTHIPLPRDGHVA